MDTRYWLAPVGHTTGQAASEIIQSLVVGEKIYAFGEQMRSGRRLKAGDWICFYEKGNGIVAHARVLTNPERQLHSRVRDIGNYPWVFKLEAPKFYPSSAVVIDGNLRRKLDAFKGHAPTKRWSWFVQSTREISQHDFDLLTG
jgi:hypothetical protein